jgi:2,4-diaminopentanoate dehydrogenase
VATSGIPVVLMGLGEIGQAIGRAVLARPDLQIVAALDPDPAKVGRALAEVLGIPAPNVIVAADPRAALPAAKGGGVLPVTLHQF